MRPDPDSIGSAVDRLETYIVSRRYRGYDPYDALCSPLFALPLLRSVKVLRQAAQQTLRRSPVNVRPLLGIRPGYNPVTLGLALHGYAELAATDARRQDELAERTTTLVAELRALRSDGYSGDCWGYDFPWQTRGGNLPSFTPTIVATCFVTNGLFSAYEQFDSADALDMCESACAFLMNDLARTEKDDGSFCWSYSPFGRIAVLNATAKGSRLCTQVWSATRNEELLDAARRSLSYVASYQHSSGAFPYAIDDPRAWADCYHTGYVLDAFAEWNERTGDTMFATTMERGFEYFRGHFFEDDRVPRYYDHSTYPIDATSCAQALLTLVRYGDLETANRVAQFAVDELQLDDGSFGYQINRRYRNRISYMRWSNAWMLSGLSAVVGANRRAADRSTARTESR